MNVYNMGLGGYAQAHSLLQLDHALEFSPDLVIVVFYFGNDFFDNFNMSQYSESISKYLTEAEQQDITELENSQPLSERARYLFGTTNRIKPKKDKAEMEKGAIHEWLSHNSALWSLLREFRNGARKYMTDDLGILADDFQEVLAAITPEQLKYCSIFEGNEWRTIFTSPYRNLGNDRSDRRIDIGFELALRLFSELQYRVSSSGAELLVVMLPTKESAFLDKVLEPDAHISYTALCDNEEQNRKQLKQFLDQENIRYLDVLPALRMAQEQPYRQNTDGHPNVAGHKVIANTVADWIKAGHQSPAPGTADSLAGG